jgi:putative SOS response-associated peptidase YedK
MCGKFTQLATWREVHAFSQPLTLDPTTPVVVSTPMRFANILRLNPQGVREVVPMRWGFPDRAASNPARPKHMHGRAETIDTRPTFATAFRNGRGILMVQSFNEGEELPSGKTKQWVITPKDGHPIAIAVIAEDWVNGEERLPVFVQVTTPANALIAPVTDRMPAILHRDAWPVWLGETEASLADVKALLRTFEVEGAWSIAPQDAPPKGKPPQAQASLF